MQSNKLRKLIGSQRIIVKTLNAQLGVNAPSVGPKSPARSASVSNPYSTPPPGKHSCDFLDSSMDDEFVQSLNDYERKPGATVSATKPGIEEADKVVGGNHSEIKEGTKTTGENLEDYAHIDVESESVGGSAGHGV